MKSHSAYGLERLPVKALAAVFFISVLVPLASVALKAAGVIMNAKPVVVASFGVIGVGMLLLGVYMVSEAVRIRKTFILTNAKVDDVSLSLVGRKVRLGFAHAGKQHVATVVLSSGHTINGSSMRLLFNPARPAHVYIYGFRYFYIPAVPLIVGGTFLGIVVNIISG